jgi:hypothetical protein
LNILEYNFLIGQTQNLLDGQDGRTDTIFSENSLDILKYFLIE